MLKVLTVFSATRCQPLPAWQGLVISTSETTQGVSVNVSCAEGLLYIGNITYPEASVTCDYNGEWIPASPTCQGM